MKIANATKLNRKSGVPEWRDLRCASCLGSYRMFTARAASKARVASEMLD
jgi:hypothetical protein